MTKILVWDIPARLFHLAFALSLTAAMGIGFLVDDEGPLFQLHMIFGIVTLFLLLIRMIMGWVGSSSHAVWGVVITMLAGAWIAALVVAHDSRTATVEVPGIGVTLQLGENKSGEDGHERGHDDDD